MQRILWVQKSLRCLQDRRTFHELKKGATILQSFIRGSLVRKNLITNAGSYHNIVNQVPAQNQVLDSVLTDARVLTAEVALRQKEEENIILRKQLQEYEMRCSDNEAKLKSMQELWQKQMTSLQMNLPAVKNTHQPERLDALPAQRFFDSEGTMSTDALTPEGMPARNAHTANVRQAINSDNTQNAVCHLARELEQKKKVFEADARVIVEEQPAQSSSSKNPKEDPRKLNSHFASWKKDYKAQLKEARAKVRKLVVSDGEKGRNKCWKMRHRSKR